MMLRWRRELAGRGEERERREPGGEGGERREQGRRAGLGHVVLQVCGVRAALRLSTCGESVAGVDGPSGPWSTEACIFIQLSVSRYPKSPSHPSQFKVIKARNTCFPEMSSLWPIPTSPQLP